MKTQKFLLTVLGLCLTACSVQAESIELNSGEIIQGKVVEKTEDFVKVDIGIGIPVTYYLDEVQKISSEPISSPTSVSETRTRSEDSSEEEVQPAESAPVPKVKTTESSGGTQKTAKPLPPAPTEKLPPAPKIEKSSPSGTRRGEESFLMDRLQKQIESPQGQQPREFQSKEEYLKHQLEHQTQLQTQKINSIIRSLDQQLTSFLEQYVLHNPQIQKILAPLKGRVDLSTVLGILGGIYALYCLPLMLIARKFHLSGLMAWIPILQCILAVRIADKSFWWFFLLLIPPFTFLAVIIVGMGMARRLQQPSGLGIAMIIPGMNLLVLWYLVFVRIQESA